MLLQWRLIGRDIQKKDTLRPHGEARFLPRLANIFYFSLTIKLILTYCVIEELLGAFLWPDQLDKGALCLFIVCCGCYLPFDSEFLTKQPISKRIDVISAMYWLLQEHCYAIWLFHGCECQKHYCSIKVQLLRLCNKFKVCVREIKARQCWIAITMKCNGIFWVECIYVYSINHQVA